MAIKHRRMGRHGVIVSNLCLGTMNFSWKTDEKESFKIMDRALELGINFFDTADVYGGKSFDQRGQTEEVIGRWFAQKGGRREAVVLATKVYGSINRSDRLPEPNTDALCLSGMKIKKHCADSLRRLQTEWIDLYQMHHIDRLCPWDEIWSAFGALQTQGKIVYSGSSNFAGWDIATACQEATRRGMSRLISEQSVYNLTKRVVELEVIPACRHYGLGLIPWSPLAGGMLAGSAKRSAQSARRQGSDVSENTEKHRDQLVKYEQLCQDIGQEPATVALAWLLHNPIVSSVIIGPRTVEQLEDSLAATELVLEQEILDKLDSIFPGTNGEAPTAYAW